MNTNPLTREQAGKLVAYWNRKPTQEDQARYLGMIKEAISYEGIICDIVRVDTEPITKNFGYAPIAFDLVFRNIPASYRSPFSARIKNFSRIHIEFKACKGYYYENPLCHTRHDRENAVFAKFGDTDRAREIIDNFPDYDGEVLEYSARTDAHICPYRCRRWEILEGKNHFGYGATYADIEARVFNYLVAVFRELGIREMQYKGRSNNAA